MNFRYLILIFSLVLSSCNKTYDLKIKKYVNSNFASSEYVKVYLDDYETYGELMKILDSLACNDEMSKIIFDDKEFTKDIEVFVFCSNNLPIFDPKSRNTIILNNGMFVKNDVFYNDLDSLSYIMKMDYENYGLNPNYAVSPEKVLFIVSDSNTKKIASVKFMLNEITAAFDKLKMKEDLIILLAYNINESPPPPPPPN
jgi:hypothetical protein